ncbi:hypothetical protein BKA66DRAFT_83553 [Pyrenochaeta sp. MPI-SDFR-AT-0127]|nr:hypothetical protein BKA66DRAFT_83553 [Pyrenochaeta sp. MPI-SDFR-AT-0127]
MSTTSGTLVVISCSESDPRVDPARYFNLTGNTTQVIKTAGARTEGAINNIYHIDQSNKIGMIVVVQHSTCAWSPGDVEANIRSDIQTVRNSPYVRNEIPTIGYVLDVATGQLREVKTLFIPSHWFESH